MGISVVDLGRDDALNTRFVGLFPPSGPPPAVIVNCSETLGALALRHGVLANVPVTAMYHSVHQAWHGIAPYLTRQDQPKHVLAHVDGVIQFVLYAAHWTWVPDPRGLDRVIFDMFPAPASDPAIQLLGKDISDEIWRNQRLDRSHSAILWNYS